jgi:hypothetical protein
MDRGSDFGPLSPLRLDAGKCAGWGFLILEDLGRANPKWETKYESEKLAVMQTP